MILRFLRDLREKRQGSRQSGRTGRACVLTILFALTSFPCMAVDPEGRPRLVDGELYGSDEDYWTHFGLPGGVSTDRGTHERGSVAYIEFPFTNPDDGSEYVLSMQAVFLAGQAGRFVEHVFDFAANRHTRDIVAVAANDQQMVYVSGDLGQSWNFVKRLDSPFAQSFTTASGVHLIWDLSGNRLRRFDASWEETTVVSSQAYAWHGGQGGGQHGDTIMLAEYWSDDARAEGHVFRSRDDGLTWDIVFTVLSRGANVPRTQQVRHFHTLQPDPYHPGRWYLSSGDWGYESHVWVSQNDGDSWEDVTDYAPNGTDLQQVHRYTSILFTPDRLLWATDDRMGGTGAVFVEAERGEPLDVHVIGHVTTNEARNLVDTDAGTVVLTQNGANEYIVPGPDRSGYELALFTRQGRLLPIGLLPVGVGGLTYSLAGHQAVDGVFFSYADARIASRFARWELRSSPIALQRLIEGGEAGIVDLGTVLPGQEVVSVESSGPEVVSVEADGNLLYLTPLRRGDAEIWIAASDGVSPGTTTTTFRVLVNPAAHVIGEGSFAFTRWSQDEPEGAYPEHMLFLQSDRYDPDVETPLQHAYLVPHYDYGEDDLANIGYPYRNTQYARLNGLGENGISFVNALGHSRDLGGALVALNTLGQRGLRTSWTCGTVAAGARKYAIRLQYRVGVEGPFQDVLFHGAPVEYLSAGAGDTEMMGPVPLPSETDNQEYVQLLWRYYHVSGNTGWRAQLRLDDIVVCEGLKASIASGDDSVHKGLGTDWTITATAAGQAGNVTYQWFHIDSDHVSTMIPGADGPVLRLEMIDSDDAGWYVCQVSDGVSTVSSAPVQLVVVPRVPSAGRIALWLWSAMILFAGARALRRRVG